VRAPLLGGGDVVLTISKGIIDPKALATDWAFYLGAK